MTRLSDGYTGTESHKHNFRNSTSSLDIEVRAARLDNETEAYESETEWAVGFEIL